MNVIAPDRFSLNLKDVIETHITPTIRAAYRGQA